jgi:Tol biopolymer transport system component
MGGDTARDGSVPVPKERGMRGVWRTIPLVVALLITGGPSEASGPRTRLMSVNNQGKAAEGDSRIYSQALSNDGTVVAFASDGLNLPSGDGATTQAYIRARDRGRTILMSRTTQGALNNGNARHVAVSGDGTAVAFTTNASTFPGENGFFQVYVRDLDRRRTILVSLTTEGDPAQGTCDQPSLSRTGERVVFSCDADNFPGRDGTSDVYLHDVTTRRTVLVSRRSAGPAANGDSNIYGASISGGGNLVVFQSDSSNLPGGGSTSTHAYLRNLRAGRTTQLDHRPNGTPANGPSYEPAISANGRYAGFHSSAGNLPGGSGSYYQVYLLDLQTGRLKLVSRNNQGTPGDADSQYASVSNRGDVAFESQASNLGGNTAWTYNAFLRRREMGRTIFLGRTNAGGLADGSTQEPVVNADGRFAAFWSSADNLPEGDGSTEHVYLRGPFPSS